MGENMQIVYSEVFEILSYMDRKIVLKTPIEIIEFIRKNRKEEYISKIDKKDIFNKDNVQRKTLSILAWLNLKYWEDNEETKKELIKMYRKNDIKYEMKLKEQYVNKELFNKNKKEQNFDNSIVTVKKENFIERLLSRIKVFLENHRKT